MLQTEFGAPLSEGRGISGRGFFRGQEPQSHKPKKNHKFKEKLKK